MAVPAPTAQVGAPALTRCAQGAVLCPCAWGLEVLTKAMGYVLVLPLSG